MLQEINGIQSNIYDLKREIEGIEQIKIVEDYFEVNDVEKVISSKRPWRMGYFCAGGRDKIIEFDLSATVDTAVDNFTVVLMFDDETVAQTQISDSEAPSHLSLFYRGKISGANSQVKI